MNKHCYRIIFNKARGMLMAVAEIVTSQGKAAGTTLGKSVRPPSVVATVRKMTFAIWSVLGLVMLPAMVEAQIVADRNAPANQRPIILNAPNGVPLVNIRTPSAAGVSRNTYSQFDVQKQGAILNNSRTSTQTQLGGWVQGNDMLAAGAARVILNEVNSSNPSLLRGYVEIAGTRAQLVIANPSGVTCDGCGFINANRTTLTTGTPVMNNGNLEGYLVQDGVITITGAGLDAGGSDYTDLIARAVAVNAGIWTQQLNVTAGANQVNADNTTATAIAGTGTRPAIGIDVAQLGGMYAGKIVLVGTEAGVGVRNAGNIGASVGEVVVTAAGRIENIGNIASTGNTQISSSSDIQNSGVIYAQGDASLTARGNLNNSNTILTDSNATINAANLDNTRSDIIAGKALSVTVAQTLTNAEGSIIGGQQLNLGGAVLDNTRDGVLASAGDMSISGGTLDNQGGQVQALGNININLSGELNNTSSLVRSGQTLSANAGSIINANTQDNNQGMEGQSVNLQSWQINNRSGVILANNQLSLTSSGTIDNTKGIISSGAVVALQDTGSNQKTLDIANSDGLMIAGQKLTVDSANLTGDGVLLSERDLAIKLTNDFTNTGQIIANGGVSLETAGTITNQSDLFAGRSLDVKANNIDNQVDGQMVAGQVTLGATDTMTNRGLIDSRDTTIAAGTLNNLGTGRIYGDDIAIAANTLNNDVENGRAAVIAARNRLDIGAETINNREHAMIFSAGDMAVGGSLDADKYATGQATTINNNSATIEALGDLEIAAKQINNTNEHFSTVVEQTGSEWIVEYQGSGSPNRYRPGDTDVYIYNDESDYLHTPEGNHEQWTGYYYTRTTNETVVETSDPGQIIAGGNMRITADNLLNDKSRIMAGGTLIGDIGNLVNTEVAGTRTITDSGTVTSYWRNYKKGRDDTGSSSAGYAPPETVQAISLTPSVYKENTATAGSGMQIVDLSTTGVGQSATGAKVASVAINPAVPDNSMFHLKPNGGYLIETDPGFANYRNWLSSDYLLNALSMDPSITQTRLGDGFYEQKLIREQVAALTGNRFLEGYASDEEQYRALMANAVAFAEEYQLRPGIALTATQMASLTSDIVWLVEQEVTLPGGETAKVLVPQLYVQVKDGDLQTSGALIAANNVNLNLSGDLVNSGTIAGRNVVALTAENINNLGGRISGNDVGLVARTDLNNIGGQIQASNSLQAIAGRDLNVTSTTSTQSNAQGSNTNIDRVAGLYVTGGDGTMLVAAGRDVNLNAAAIVNAINNLPATAAGPDTVTGAAVGSTTIVAGNNINLGTVAESSDSSISWGGANYRNESSRTDIGTAIQTQGDITMQAGNDINAKAANVNSDQGMIMLNAGNNVNLVAGEANRTVDEGHQHTSKGFLNKKTITTVDTLDQTMAAGTTISGNTVAVIANQDINLKGSNVVSTDGTILYAQNNINVEAATNTITEGHLRDEKKSGLLSSGGIGFTVGTRQMTVDQKNTGTTSSASTVGSTNGDVVIMAGENYKQVGSNVIATQGNIDIMAKTVDILEAQNVSHNVTETRFKQTGLTLAVTSPVISAIQTAQSMSKAASETKDARMTILAGASTALAGKNAYDAVQAGQGTTINGKEGQIATGKDANGDLTSRDANAADQAGGVNISLSIGTSQSKSTTVIDSTSATGSTVAAGGNVNIIATGAGKDSNLTIQGSNVSAGNDINLIADNAINLLAAKNTVEQHSKNSSMSGSIGVSFGTNGFGVTAAASTGRGNADGSDVTWTNTHVNAGNKLNMQSGGDTNIIGAVASGNEVIAKVGGNLNIESLQDTSTYSSKQMNAGGSITIGAGVSGSLNFSQSKMDSDYASVVEQSGIKAGDGGFQVDVQGNTDLKGAVIASTEKAVQDSKNNFRTGGTLTTSDIKNHASYKASAVSVGFGSGVSLDGKLAGFGTGAGMGKDSGNSSSTTQSGISGIAGNQAVRSDDAETGIKKIFDPGKVQKNIDAQVKITQAFNQLAPKAAADYASQKVRELRTQAALETDPTIKAELEAEAQKWAPNGSYNMAMNIIISAAGSGTPGAVSSAVKEGLAWASNEMRQAAVADSRKFKGVCIDGTKDCISNISGKSEGVNGDGVKIGGGRIDIGELCKMPGVCIKDAETGTWAKNEKGQILINEMKDANGDPMTTKDLLESNPKLVSPLGGLQGGDGSFLGVKYEKGDLLDKVVESFAGSHDTLNSKYWYDEQGNIRQDMTAGEKRFGEVLNAANVVVASPFGLSTLLPPEVWSTIAAGIKGF